ncbi:DUF3466 family protein [uncultured Paraglaciecola sp.]|uniref:DUF3466 family protein n=1 Tax=uncultured Paraglaciecola sp. TaxID=1765024 RepID=UPI0025CE7AF3|nr:DUF3466 family protein [uncultured Paraglaciecola sp.]
MTKTRLAATLSLALIVAPVSQAARYRVVELPVTDKGQSTFPSAIGEDGNIIVNVTGAFNIPIDLDLLDFDSEALMNVLTDVESARNGNFNSTDYEIILALIKAADGTQNSQQIANSVGFLASESETTYIPGFDQFSDQDNEFTFNSTTLVRDVNDSGFSVGTGEGFYSNLDYTLESGENVTFVLHDFGIRAFVNLGNTVVGLPAPMTSAGGISEAYGINESNQVIGYGSTLIVSDSLETSLANCEDDELRGDVPLESCINSIISSFTGSATSFAQLRGLIWQLDGQGNLLDTKELGILFEPDADDASNYSSQAFAINDNGIAVGVSNGQYTENDVTAVRNFAVIFDQDEIINITPEPDSNVARSSNTISSAADINNDNFVVGHQVKSVNGTNRRKFFVHDMLLGETTFPNDYFLGSSSIALDINNNGMVVGYGEVDASLTGRRNEGFLYDIAAEQFYGIRELISCDSPYTIVQANSINDNNEIAATALYSGSARDSRGEILLDSAGNEIQVELVTAVKLELIPGGEIDKCDSIIDEINRERQGASVTWMLAFGALILCWRRFKKYV